MTRLPFDTWNITPRLDLPPYELNAACPVTGEVSGLEDHHIVRRSFTALGKEDNDRLFWIELPTGEIVGNRINLSSAAHYRVTVNKARIAYTEPEQAFYWVEGDEWTRLRWQPPHWGVQIDPQSNPDYVMDATDEVPRPVKPWEASAYGIQSQAVMGDTIYDMHTHEVVGKIGPQPGEECTACHRRVPHPKKKTSPLTSVFSTRVPIGDKETFAELVDAAAEHMGAKSKPHHVYNTLLVGLALILQSPKEDLPNG